MVLRLKGLQITNTIGQGVLICRYAFRLKNGQERLEKKVRNGFRLRYLVKIMSLICDIIITEI